jgi:hypothetical protein
MLSSFFMLPLHASYTETYETAGILPFVYEGGKTWFLLGREHRDDEWVKRADNYWFDFRGKKEESTDQALAVAYKKLNTQAVGLSLKDPYLKEGPYTLEKLIDRDSQMIFQYRTTRNPSGEHIVFFLPVWAKVNEASIRAKVIEKNPHLKNHAWSWVEGDALLHGKTGLESEFYPPFRDLISSKEARKLILKILLANPQEDTHAWANRPKDLGLNEQTPFAVLILSYNNAQVYQQNLKSTFDQTYKNYHIIYVDDASLDKTGELVEKYIKAQGMQNKVVLIKNTKNQGALKNNYDAIQNHTQDSDVVVALDGDDWFSHKNVLALLSIEYSTPSPYDVWLTYGQHELAKSATLGIAQQIPVTVLAQNTIRQYTWVTSALRTYKAKLFKHIKLEDLQYTSQQGEKKFFETANDIAIMIPMVEIAQWHTRFIPDVLYIYNAATQFSTFKVKPGKEKELEALIRSKKPYQPLKAL